MLAGFADPADAARRLLVHVPLQQRGCLVELGPGAGGDDLGNCALSGAELLGQGRQRLDGRIGRRVRVGRPNVVVAVSGDWDDVLEGGVLEGGVESGRHRRRRDVDHRLVDVQNDLVAAPSGDETGDGQSRPGEECGDDQDRETGASHVT